VLEVTVDTDQEQQVSWLRRVALGDEDAFTQIFKHYESERRLWRYLYRLLQDSHRADELFVEVMFEVWKNAASFAGKAKPSTWVFGIAHNRAMTALRIRKPWEALGWNDADYDPHESCRLEAEQDQDRLGQCLRQAVDVLSQKHKEVVYLYLEDFSVREIAMIVGCNEGTVKSRMFHARKHLKMKLSLLGITEYPLP